MIVLGRTWVHIDSGLRVRLDGITARRSFLTADESAHKGVCLSIFIHKLVVEFRPPVHPFCTGSQEGRPQM